MDVAADGWWQLSKRRRVAKIEMAFGTKMRDLRYSEKASMALELSWT